MLVQFQLFVENFCLVFKPFSNLGIVVVSLRAAPLQRLELAHGLSKFCQDLFGSFTAVEALFSELN